MRSTCPVVVLESLERRSLLSGVTLITHGQGGSAGGDVKETADRIAARAGGAALYIMIVDESGSNVVVTDFVHVNTSPTTPSSGETIISLDWSRVNTLPTPSIAKAVADYMLTRRADGSTLVDSELHLAGPSRGASVVSNLAQELGRRGVWIDQVTYIDPVPVEIPIPGLDIGDGPMRVPTNVVFADNYWRSDDDITTGFDGRHVPGAHEGDLNNTVQQDPLGDPHTSVGAYYIATIDPSEPFTAPASWYQGTAAAPARDQTGFFFSRIAGGTRPADGLNPSFGGTGHRDGVASSSTQWSNVGYLKLRGSATVPDGKALGVSFLFEDRDSASTVSIYLDKDRNPYNGNTVSRIAQKTYGTTNGVAGARLFGSTIEASPGTHYVYAQIRDKNGHIRYSYLPDAITIVTPPSNLMFATLSNGHLQAQGDDTVNRIFLTGGGSQIAVTRHDFTQLFSASSVTSITIDGAGGDDSLGIGDLTMGVVLIGQAGSDTLLGGAGKDTLLGGGGKDRLFGLGNSDRLSGGSGNDNLYGGAGRDTLYGDSGNDILDGGTSNDRLFGGTGADTVNGGLGVNLAATDGLDLLGRVEEVVS